MTQKTFEVEHPGTHAPTAEQISKALTAALREDDLARDGDYKIIAYSETSGGPSKYTVDVPTKKRGAAETAEETPTADTPAEGAKGAAGAKK